MNGIVKGHVSKDTVYDGASIMKRKHTTLHVRHEVTRISTVTYVLVQSFFLPVALGQELYI